VVNEYLADALADARMLYDFIDLTADIKRAAAAGGKSKLLLVDHKATVYMAFLWVCTTQILTSLQAGIVGLGQLVHDLEPGVLIGFKANANGIQFECFNREITCQRVDQGRAVGCLIEQAV